MGDKKLRITKCDECRHVFEGMDDYYVCGLKGFKNLNLGEIHKDCPLEDY